MGLLYFLSRSMSAAWRRANLLSALAARQEISPASTWKTPPLTFLCVETRIEGNGIESYINTISKPNEMWKDFIICSAKQAKAGVSSLSLLPLNTKTSTKENRISIEIPTTICLFCWIQQSSLSPEMLHKTKKSICLPIKRQQTHLSVSTHTGSALNLALQMRN